MALATLDDRTPTTAKAIEAHYWALDPRIRAKRAALDAQREGHHAIVDALRLKLHALREELVTKRRRLSDAIANARPELSHGESDPRGAAATVTTGGFPQRPVREQEVARLAENLQRAEAAYQAAEERWAASARVAQNCQEWLAATPIDRVVVVVVPFTRVADPHGELVPIRERLRAIATETQAIEVAPVGREETLARLDAQRKRVAERVAARRAERVRGFFSPRGISDIARLGLTEGYGSVGREVEAAIEEAADERFLADVGEWRSAIKAAPIAGQPVPLAERVPRVAQLARDRTELERQEERVVMCAERDGLQLDRREDADPAIVVCTVLADAAA